MKIICAGFWKTGTKSLAEALRMLGYTVYDYDDQFFELGGLWSKFFNGTVTDDEIRKELKDIDVLIDGPVVAFWEEICKVFPEAKVILTIRDEDSWYKSYKGMNDGVSLLQMALFMVSFLTPAGNRFISRVASLVHFCQGVEGPFKIPILNLTDNPRLYKLKFRKHNCHVLYTVPKDKLLIHEAKDGWAPLCLFLGEENPPCTPYPYKNKLGAHMKSEGGPQNAEFHKVKQQSMVLLGIISVVFLYGIYALLSWVFQSWYN